MGLVDEQAAGRFDRRDMYERGCRDDRVGYQGLLSWLLLGDKVYDETWDRVLMRVLSWGFYED